MKKAKRKHKRPTGVHLWSTEKGVERKTAAGIVPILPTGGFNAHSGEVMGSPRVWAVYWGSAYGSSSTGTTPLARSLDGFFKEIFRTRYFGLLSEYSVGQPMFLGSVWLPHDPTSAIAVTSDSINNTLTAWLDGSLLPEVPGRSEKNLLYIIFLSPEMTVSTSPPGCAFHDSGHYHKGSGKNNLFYAVVGSGNLHSLTESASHELAEAFTDRTVGNGWSSDTTGAEIGDVCSCCSCPTVTLRGFTLASYWRNSVNNCLQQGDLRMPLPWLPLLLRTPAPNIVPAKALALGIL